MAPFAQTLTWSACWTFMLNMLKIFNKGWNLQPLLNYHTDRRSSIRYQISTPWNKKILWLRIKDLQQRIKSPIPIGPLQDFRFAEPAPMKRRFCVSKHVGRMILYDKYESFIKTENMIQFIPCKRYDLAVEIWNKCPLNVPVWMTLAVMGNNS